MSDTEFLKLNLGCGLIAPEGWENIDKSLSAMLARHAILRALLKTIRLLPSEVLSRKWPSNIRFYDVRKGLPFRDGSTSYVYVSNLLTALPYQETLKLFQEIYRVLVPGGIIRVVDLDVLKVTREYHNQHISQLGSGGEARLAPGESPVDKLALRLGFRVPAAQRGFLGRHFGKSRVRRVWLYDAESAKMYAESCGFVCSLKGFRDSRIPDIDAVERNEFIDTFSVEGEKRC